MNDIRTNLARKIAETSLIEGSFVLRSGKRSSEYLDKYAFESDPILLSEIGNAMMSLIPNDIDMLAGVQLGGIPLSIILSHKTSLPCVFVRPEPKTYGTCKIVEGRSPRGCHILLIEDVISSGGAAIKGADILRQLGGVVTDVLCVIDRREPAGLNKLEAESLKLHALFKMNEIKDVDSIKSTEG